MGLAEAVGFGETVGLAEVVGFAEVLALAEALGFGDAVADRLAVGLGVGFGVGFGVGLAVGVGGGGGGAGRTPGSATPTTWPSGFLKTGAGAATMPIAAARAASAPGADSASIFCCSAWVCSRSVLCCCWSWRRVNDPCASQVLTSKTVTRPAPSNPATRSTNGARAGVLGARTTRNGGVGRGVADRPGAL